MVGNQFAFIGLEQPQHPQAADKRLQRQAGKHLARHVENTLAYFAFVLEERLVNGNKRKQRRENSVVKNRRGSGRVFPF